MIITRGKRKGEEHQIHQFCNDWVTTEEGDVVGLRSIKLSPEEIVRFEAAREAGQTGMMFLEFELRPDGTFHRRADRRPAPL